MLRVLRDNLKKLKWILILVVVSFIVTIFAWWGGGGFKQSAEEAPQWAALVNGEPISIPEFMDAAKKIDEFYARLYGDRYNEIKKNLNLGAQVMNELIEEKIILQEATNLGITATPDEVSQKIMTHPAFMENGVFIGKERYTTLLKATSRNLVEFENDVRNAIIMDKWRNLIGDSIFVSNADLENEYRDANEKVGFDYIFVSAMNYEKSLNISDEEAKDYFSKNSKKYNKGELRRAKFIKLSRDEVKNEVQITEDAIRNYYQSNISSFQQPEQVAAKHILIKVDPGSSADVDEKARKKAEDILKRIKTGENFEALAKQFSDDEGSAQNGGDLGRFQRGMMVKEFEDAAFAIGPGEVSDIVKTQFGYHIIQVSEKLPAKLIALEEIKDRIRKQLEFEKTQELLESKMNKIRAEIKSPDQFEEVAKAHNLKVMDTNFISRDQRVPELGTSLEFQKVLFALQPFEIGGPVTISQGLTILLFVEKQEGKTPAFEAVREEVLQDLRSQKAAEEAYRALRAALSETGSNMEAAAKKLQLEIKSAKEISKTTPIPEVGRLPSIVDELLKASPGEIAGPLRIPQGAFAAKIKEVMKFDPLRFMKEKNSFKENLLNGKREMLIANIVQNIKTQKEIRINTDLLRQTGI